MSQAVHACDRRIKFGQPGTNYLFVGGQENDLVGRSLEVAAYQVLAVRRVEAAQRCIDDCRYGSTRRSRKPPEQRGGEELTFARREPFEGNCLPCGI